VCALETGGWEFRRQKERGAYVSSGEFLRYRKRQHTPYGRGTDTCICIGSGECLRCRLCCSWEFLYLRRNETGVGVSPGERLRLDTGGGGPNN